MIPEYTALVPAYEPDEKLLGVLSDLKRAGFRTITVNDGSGDDYSDIFEKAGELSTVLVHDKNMGKGRALKTGLEYIQENSGSECVIVTVDADGQHRVADALRVCRKAEENPGSLVLGSRRFTGCVPLRSRLGNSITRFVYSSSTGLKVYDTQTGLRAFTGDMIPRLLEVAGDRYEYEMNMLLDFAKEGIPIIEEEIETVYIDENQSSHFDTVKDSFRIYKEILKFSASSLIGFITDYAMYALLTLLTGNLILSNVGARLVSATVNFSINRKFVFGSNGSLAKAAAKYAALAAGILAGNTLVLSLLVNYAGIGRMIAKVLTELIFFAVSWLVQRYFIFKKGDKDDIQETHMGGKLRDNPDSLYRIRNS